MGIFDFLRKRDDGAVHGAPLVSPPDAANGSGAARGGTGAPRDERRVVGVALAARPERPGDLHDLAALNLPAGRVVRPDGDPEAAPVAWVTEDVADHVELWARLVRAFPETGLWPVIASGMEGQLRRPWFDGELGGPEQPAPDVEGVLRQRIEDTAELQQDYGVPEPEEAWKSEWAGLAPGGVVASSVELRCPAEPFGLALVPTMRPADVPAAIGWWGPTNHDLGGGELSAVLRSWEGRFGAVLTSLGFDTLELAVASPPADDHAANLLAREHYAVCPDNIDQGAGDIETYVAMVASPEWYFWWD
ncbi:hypothetical protein BA895_04195 [Humibacillus sp. DSM 29435]|uniref:DUF4253 domain-containing protein n=1 Tax=Humibacillus sp. DSM 29435 TaxID=1869167 RepID=UPI000872F11C|nr:DUF4253 domain-containing protein [Humibacillus sp. DSM 29435]OFE16774.1 hypothetical protein BA895_04195 [Humibacillus sp. DSM 29435]